MTNSTKEKPTATSAALRGLRGVVGEERVAAISGGTAALGGFAEQVRTLLSKLELAKLGNRLIVFPLAYCPAANDEESSELGIRLETEAVFGLALGDFHG